MILLGVLLVTLAILFALTALALRAVGKLRRQRTVAVTLTLLLVLGIALLLD